jgi:hypothetical protein
MKVHGLVLLLLAEDITKLERMNGADQMAGERAFGARADHGPDCRLNSSHPDFKCNMEIPEVQYDRLFFTYLTQLGKTISGMRRRDPLE